MLINQVFNLGTWFMEIKQSSSNGCNRNEMKIQKFWKLLDSMKYNSSLQETILFLKGLNLSFDSIFYKQY